MSRSSRVKPRRIPGTVHSPEPLPAVRVGIDVYFRPFSGDEVRLADVSLAATFVATP
jgi:hypothetical protein